MIPAPDAYRYSYASETWYSSDRCQSRKYKIYTKGKTNFIRLCLFRKTRMVRNNFGERPVTIAVRCTLILERTMRYVCDRMMAMNESG